MNLLREGNKVWRRIAGRDTEVERFVRQQRNRIKYRLEGSIHRRDVYVARGNTGPRFGLYAHGSCDLWSVVNSGRPISKLHPGGAAVRKVGLASDGHTELLLQTLDDFPRDAAAEIGQRFRLADQYFEPTVFAPTFQIPHHPELGEFPKSATIISIVPDLVRSLYQHREHGFLIDPGGWWLAQPLHEVLGDLEEAQWFARTFKKVGKISVEDFHTNLLKLIPLIRHKTGGDVIVFSALTVETGTTTTNYSLLKENPARRRREFHISLAEASAKLDFSIIDVDRAAKSAGIGGQADFPHFLPEARGIIVDEIVRVLRERELVSG